MAKIILIDPPGWQGTVSGFGPCPNIGIAYLVPMLRKNGHKVSVIDLNNEAMTDDQILSAVDEYHPEIVGFSVKTATSKNARILAQKVKKILPRVHVIIGGPHCKFAWRELVVESWFDIVFVGEGEQVLPTICNRLMADQAIEDLPGVMTKRNSNHDFRLNRPLIAAADMNFLPFPQYDLFPQNVKQSLRANYPLLTSRGCVYDCTFCSVPEISGKGFRKRSPKSVIDELRWAQEKYGATAFEIVDDVFNLDMRRCKEICCALIEAKLGMSWSCPNGLRVDRVDRELAELMFKSGCHSVNVGVESADPYVLAAVKKGETIQDIERGIRIFKEAGMRVIGYFIIGLPGDSLKLQERSVEFAKRVGIDAHFNMLVPYPGTECWEWAKANARFLRSHEDGLHFADDPDKLKIVIETDDFPASERQRAYEMVHTRLRRFNMLIPPNLSRWQRYHRIIHLLWHYDRFQLPAYMLRNLFGKFRRMLGRLMHLARETSLVGQK